MVRAQKGVVFKSFFHSFHMFLVIVINVFSTVAGLESFQIHLMAIIVINFRFFIDSSGKKFKVLWFMTILFDVTNEHVFKEFVH